MTDGGVDESQIEPRARRRLDVLSTPFFPAYVVWELTLRCDLACTHCGSRGGKARPHELTTGQALAVVDELAAMKTREVVLIGGEAYLHPGFLDIARALREAGITPVVTTGGRGITAQLARAMADAGIERVSVSLDGLQATHDRMRALQGSFEASTAALHHCRDAGIAIAANSNFNRLNRGDLEGLFEHLCRHQVRAWQIQLTTPLGRAADRTDMILQPWDLLDLMPRVAAVKRRAAAVPMTVMVGNNFGYFGPEEATLRSPRPGGDDHWQGCQAGRFVMGIESDGSVKGCPSLQTSHYVGGRLGEASLDEIWNQREALAFTRSRTVEDLWGFCRECPFAAECLGGCSFTAHAILGRPGNNPYCHFRARHFAKQGLRERLVPSVPARGEPFDNGLFEVVVEPAGGPEPEIAQADLVAITRRPSGRSEEREL